MAGVPTIPASRPAQATLHASALTALSWNRTRTLITPLFRTSPSIIQVRDEASRTRLSQHHTHHSSLPPTATTNNTPPNNSIQSIHQQNRPPKMPSSDYTSVTRGALKLKGSKVQKSNKKSKKSKDKTSNNLETALQRTSETEDDSKKPIKSQEEVELETRKSTSPAQEGDQQQLQEQEPEEDLKTEAERRFAEIKRKRVRYSFSLPVCLPSIIHH